MLSLSYQKTLTILHNKFMNSGIEWYIIGKTNLALQGVDVEPSHLGIIIHDHDLDKFVSLFSEYKHNEINELKNGDAKEFIMFIDDLKGQGLHDVELLVCAEYDHGIYWEVMNKPVMINLENIQLPCFSLESELQAYTKLGLLETAKKIEEVINKNSI